MIDPILAFLIELAAGVLMSCIIVRVIRGREMAWIEAEVASARRTPNVQRRVRNFGQRPRVALAWAVR